MNNFEKIKNMTLDEMAELFELRITSNNCAYCNFYNDCKYSGLDCEKFIKQWLQAESEG